MNLRYIFTLIVLAIMNITLFICAINGIDSKPRNETTAIASPSPGQSSIKPTVIPLKASSAMPVDADKGHVKSNLSERNTQWLKQKRHITCGCNFSKTPGCSNFRSVFDSVSRYDKGKEHQFYDNTFPLFNMTANEKESATNIFTPYIIDNSFDFRIEKPLYLSWLLLFMHNLCTETVPSKIMSACKSDRWLEPASNIYNCRKRLDLLARDYFPDGIGILENNKDGFTIHTLIDRIIRKIDSDINDCLDKILNQDQKANVASYYAEAVENKSIYDILDKDRRKYSSVVLPKHTRRKRNIKFTVTSNQKTETSNQGNSGHEINKQLDPDVKTRLNRVLQEESSGSSGVIQ